MSASRLGELSVLDVILMLRGILVAAGTGLR
jgi:hypothetical protein